MGECWMLSRLRRPAHRADGNWAPLSNVMVAGTPNRDIPPAVVMDESGKASDHL